MIEQHIYEKTELGLSTFAKSKGLAEGYIESNIRPYYSAVDIFYLEGKSFPGLKCAIPLSDGSVLVGTGVKADGEGRAYIHSFVANAASLSVLAEKSGFFTAPPPEGVKESPVLPSLSDMECGRAAGFFKTLKSINMSKGEYTALLAAIFASREQNRNVFISLGKNADISEAALLMSRLYADLPYYLRRCIGFYTLYGEVYLRPEVNIYFIPPEKLSLSKKEAFVEGFNVSKDYIFDIENKQYLHINDLKEDVSGEYVELTASCLEGGKRQEEFFAFAEAVSQGMSHEKRMSLRFYDDLAYIYNMRENEESLPSKIGRVTVAFSEILKSGAGEAVAECYSEFIRIYRKHLKSRQAAASIEILRRLVANYDKCPKVQKEELYDLLTLDIELCMKAEDDEAVFTHVNAMRASAELYNRITENKMLPSKSLIKRYFTYMLDKKRTIHSLMEYADSVYQDMPQMKKNSILRDMLSERATELYNTSGDRLEAVKYLEGKCAALEGKYPEIKELFASVYNYALESAMTSVSVADITLSQLERFPLRGAEEINPELTLKHKILLAAKEILALTDDLALSFVNYDAFGFEQVAGKLSDDPTSAKKAEGELKALLKRILPEKKASPKRMLYTIEYYVESTDKPTAHTDFDAIYSFIDKELEAMPFEFIEWYLSGGLYMTPIVKNGRITREVSPKKPQLSELSAFYDATARYFSGHGRELATERETKKMKKALDRVSLLHPDYRALTLKFRKTLNTIVRESYSPLKRLAVKIASAKNFKFAALCAGCICLATAGAFIGSWAAKKMNNGSARMKSYADAETSSVSRFSWAAYKLTGEGEYVPAAGVIDDGELTEALDFDRDEKIVISFGTETGIKVDGISISALLEKESSGISVFVTDENGRRLSVGISDYDIQSGAAVYSFAEPMTVKNIIIAPTDKSDGGSAVIRDVNAYIINE